MSKIVYEIEPSVTTFTIFSRVPGRPTKEHGTWRDKQDAIRYAGTLATKHPERYIYVERRP